jgi:UDP-N-acetylglucosamine 2-epimerase (non-hydrolysing)
MKEILFCGSFVPPEINEKVKHNSPVVVLGGYVDGNVSVKVVKIIQGYTKIIDKVVWGKE